MAKSDELFMLDRALFESPEAAVEEAQRWSTSLSGVGLHSFYAGDVFVGGMSPSHMFLLSCISRAQGLVASAGREIGSGSPHAAFPLLRALMETGGLLLYAVEQPQYIAAVQGRPSEGGANRVSWQKIWNEASKTYPGVKTVWGEICEAAHPGAAAMWTSWKSTSSSNVEHGPGWVRKDDKLTAALWLWEFTRLTHDAAESFSERVLTPLNLGWLQAHANDE